MRSGSVSVHLVLDAKSVYNSTYHDLKLQLAMAHGPRLVEEFDRKLSCTAAGESYQPAAFVADVVRELQQGLPVSEVDPDTLLRLQKRKQEIAAVECKNMASNTKVLEILKQYPQDMDQGLANFVTRLPASLQQELFLQANQTLVKNIQRDIARGTAVFVANGTRRQFYSLNAFDYLSQDTSCMFADLQGLVGHLRAQAKFPELIHLDALTLHDVILDAPAGDHYKNVIGNIAQFSYYSVCDNIEFVSTYLHAQFHANQHGDVPIDMHCYVSTDEAYIKLKAQLLKYHDRFPMNVNIVITKYRDERLDRQAHVGSAHEPDKNYRHNAEKMHQALTDEALSVLVDREDSYYVAMLDADNCIYNIYYFMLLTKLVEKFGDRIIASKGKDMKSDEMVALGKEMLKFVRSYPRKDLFARSVNYTNMRKLRIPLFNKYADLELDKDIINMRDDMLADDPAMFLNNIEGPVFCQLVRIINTISPGVMINIIARANETLLHHMTCDAKDRNAQKIAFLISSMRQSYRDDLKNAVWNGTGRFHPDLKRLVALLNGKAAAGDPLFVFDDVTIVDYTHECTPGFHVALAHTDAHKAVESACDNEKRLITYKDLHHAKRKYRVKAIDFFDDSKRVFDAIIADFGADDKHGLLPADLCLTVIGYNGNYMDFEATVRGRGELDEHPYHMFKYLTKTVHGCQSLLSGKLDELPFAREQLMPAEMREHLAQTKWCKPKDFYAPTRAKTLRKIARSMQILQEEVERFAVCSNQVKFGVYAGQKSRPAREMSALLQAIKTGQVSALDGLEKMIQLAANHLLIRDAAKTLRDTMIASGEQQYVRMQFAGVGSKRFAW